MRARSHKCGVVGAMEHRAKKEERDFMDTGFLRGRAQHGSC